MRTKRYLIFFVFSLAAVALLFLAAMETASSEDTAFLHINMKAGDVLLPETKGDPDASPEVRHVAAQYDEDPLGNRMNSDWVDVGTWTAPDRETDFNFEGEFEINLWYQIIDEGYDADPQFEFTLRHGSSTRTFSVMATDPGDDTIIELVDGRDQGQHDIPKDSLLEISFRYQAWEDCDIYFDNVTYDSGLLLDSDFLQPFELKAQGKEVQLELYGNFGSDMDEVAQFIDLSVDGEPAAVVDISTDTGGTHTVYGEEVTGTFITWTLDEAFDGGENVEAWVKYTLADDGEEKGYELSVVASSGDEKCPEAKIKRIKPSPAEEGQEVSFDASECYDEDGSVERYVWKSDINGELYNGSEVIFTTNSLSAGTHKITLVVQDDDGLWSSEVTSDLMVKENARPFVTLDSPDDDELIGFDFVTLRWEGEDADGDDLNYDVYLDTDSDPETTIAEGITAEDFEADELEDGEIYYWKVVVSDGKAETESEIRSFDIRLPADNTAPTIQLDSPGKGAEITTTTVLLEWTGEDIDGDTPRYDVYFGEEAEPTIAVSLGGTGDSYDTGILTPGTTYYWKVVVSDGEEETESEVWSFTVEKKDDGGDDGDDDFEIAGVNGYIVVGGSIGAVAVIGLVAFLFMRGREDEEEYDEYDYYEDEEEYYA